MQISGAIAQLRTTDLAESIRFYTTKVGLTLEFQTNGVLVVRDVHETAWGTREFVIKDDQGHTLYFGESRSSP